MIGARASPSILERSHERLVATGRVRTRVTLPARASCGAPRRITLHDFLEQRAKATCQTSVARSVMLDEGGCERGLGPDGLENAQTLADVASGKVVHDGAAAARCLDCRRRHAGDCDPGSLRANPARAACEDIFAGTRRPPFPSKVCK